MLSDNTLFFNLEMCLPKQKHPVSRTRMNTIRTRRYMSFIIVIVTIIIIILQCVRFITRYGRTSMYNIMIFSPVYLHTSISHRPNIIKINRSRSRLLYDPRGSQNITGLFLVTYKVHMVNRSCELYRKYTRRRNTHKGKHVKIINIKISFSLQIQLYIILCLNRRYKSKLFYTLIVLIGFLLPSDYCCM